MQEYEDGKVEIELVDEIEEVEQVEQVDDGEQGEDQGDVQVEHAKHDQDTGGNSDMVELPLQYCMKLKSRKPQTWCCCCLFLKEHKVVMDLIIISMFHISVREGPQNKKRFYLGLFPKLWVGGGQES